MLCVSFTKKKKSSTVSRVLFVNQKPFVNQVCRKVIDNKRRRKNYDHPPRQGTVGGRVSQDLFHPLHSNLKNKSDCDHWLHIYAAFAFSLSFLIVIMSTLSRFLDMICSSYNLRKGEKKKKKSNDRHQMDFPKFVGKNCRESRSKSTLEKKKALKNKI